MYIVEIHEPRLFSKLPELKKILEGHEWKVKSVEILYNPLCMVPNKTYPSKWPFEAHFIVEGEEVRVKIHNIFVGYEGPGPRDLADILDFMGVKYSRDDIFTKNRQNDSGYIHLEYTIE